MTEKMHSELLGAYAPRRLRFARMFLGAAITWFCYASADFAYAQTDAERIAALEARIARLEALLERTQTEENIGASEQKRPKQRASPVRSQETTSPTPNDLGRLNQSDDFAQETFIYRDNIPTLSQHKVELSTQLGYGLNEGFLQNDRIVTSTSTLRYGIANGFEVSLNVPAYYTSRETLAGPNVIEDTVTSFGDLSMGLSKILWNQTAAYPGASLSAFVNFPTGSSPYVFGSSYVPGTNPTDIFANFLSTGSWAFGANLQFFKTLDPIILFFGGGMNYVLSQDIEGHTVQPLPTISLNGGFSFALSEKTTLAASVNYGFTNGLDVDGARIPQSEDEIAFGQLLLVQRLGDGLYLEPFVTTGLTTNAQDFGFGLTLRKRM